MAFFKFNIIKIFGNNHKFDGAKAGDENYNDDYDENHEDDCDENLDVSEAVLDETENRKSIISPYFYSLIILVVGIILFLKYGNYGISDNDKLYYKYYQPYEIDNDRNSLIEGIKAYESKKFETSLKLLEETKSDNATIARDFYLANSSIANSQFKKAILHLEKIVTDSNNYYYDASWYLGLCYLKIGELEKCKKIMSELSDTEILYKTHANKLINELRSK